MFASLLAQVVNPKAGAQDYPWGWIVGGGIAVIIGFFVILFLLGFIRLWIQSLLTGARIGMLDLVGMKLRNVDYGMIVRQKIALVQAGVKVNTEDLEAHYLARGNVPKTATAVIAAHKAGMDLKWSTAAAIDLAGRSILDAVKTSVNPKVIDCPDRAHSDYITGVAKDGVQLKCRARVTVRTNIAQLVGGATEETIIARVGEGIIGAIGAAEAHLTILENPQLISKRVLDKGLDAQTAFEILSIDIADIAIGENIGAKLRADKAESDKRIAQAKAEERRTMAVASEQEQSAEVKRMEAK